MQIENLESLQGQITPQAWRRLNGFLMSVRRGQPIDYVTPFFPKGWRSDRHAFAQGLLNMCLTGDQRLDDIERREAEKFGPFSIRLPWSEREKSVADYYSQVEVKSSISLRKSFLQIAKLIPAHSLSSLSIDEGYDRAPKGKNLGLPGFTSNREFESEYVKRAKQIAANGWKEDIFPGVVGWRGQPNGTDKPKQRVVDMYDHAGTYISTGVIAPLLDALRSLPGFAAWNDLSSVDRAITRLIDRASHPIMSVDFREYDRSLPATVIHFVFDLMRYWFTVRDTQKIDWMERQFIESGMVTPSGIFIGRHGGVPSGDSATNMVDSLAQLVILCAMCIDLGYTLQDVEVLGDDGVYSFTETVDINAISQYYIDMYGMMVSTDKGGFDANSVTFLQRLHRRDYRIHGLAVGVRSIMRTLNGIMHLERLHKKLPPEFFSARALMQAENAKNHKNFPKLMYYLYQRDRYLRELDPAVIFKKAGGVERVEDVLGLRSFKFGAELPSSGLDDFESVKWLRKMRESRKHAA
jgi:hypothetical protein